MGRFTRAVIGGVAAALLSAGAVSADFLLTDFNDGTNVSNIETYYYFYSACSDSPFNQGPCKIDDLPNVLGPDGLGFEGSSVGPGDEYGPLSYRASDLTGPDGVKRPAVLIIKQMAGMIPSGSICGPGVSTSPCINDAMKTGYYPGFGFGILLTDSDDEGIGASFEGVTGVSFKVNSNHDKFGFKVEQIENSWNWGPVVDALAQGKEGNPSATYSKDLLHPGDGTWAEFTVDFETLTRPNWGTGNFTRKNANATKIAWFINSGDHGAAAKDITFMVDDVKLIGDYSYTPADRCASCASSSLTIPTPSKKVADFENVGDPFVNTLGYYGYWYTDSVGGGSSKINNLDGEKMTLDEGSGGSGKAPVIDFEMGPAYVNLAGVKVEPFVGIGTNLYNDRTNDGFLDLKTYGFEGVYFEYKGNVTGVDWLDVEIADNFDIGSDGSKPGDKDGEIFYARVPLTSSWQSAKIPFEKFVLPRWAKQSGTRRWGKDRPLVPLQLGNLAQLKFKIKSGSLGELSVDNIYFYGASEWGVGDGELSVKHAGSKSKVSGLRATYSRGVVGVSWNAAQSIASGKVQLINTKGRVVASAPVTASGSKVTANLGARTIPTGMYFVRMNAVDAKGGKVVQQSAVSIVK